MKNSSSFYVGSEKWTKVPDEQAPSVNWVGWRVLEILPFNELWFVGPKPGLTRRNGIKLDFRPVKFFTIFQLN